MPVSANILQKIASGRFATILASSQSPRCIVVKRYAHDKRTEAGTEAQCLSKLAHRNIVSYFGTEETDGFLDLKLEYCMYGSVYDIMRDHNLFDKLCVLLQIRSDGPLMQVSHGKIGFPEKLITRVLHQALHGLSYIHGEGIVHCDIKAANMLIQESGLVKIADFNHAWVLGWSQSCSKIPIRGSVPWMAPEVKSQKSIDLSADIWSLGCFTIEMLTGCRPHPECDSAEQMLFKRSPPDIPNHVGEALKSLVKTTLAMCPSSRPSAKSLLRHPVFQPD
ncbi:hypothetical protein Q7P37_007611 [Cladosporium fusiforme]